MALPACRPAILQRLLRPHSMPLLRKSSTRSLIPFFWNYGLSPRRSDFGFSITPEDLWNVPDPFALVFPEIHRHTGYFRQPWPSEIEKKATINKDGFQVCLDVQHFAPNEISVKIVENTVIVEGEHKERSEDEGYVARRFSRRYELPLVCSIKDVVSTLSSDGILTVKVPAKEPQIDESTVHHVQIQQTGPAHLNVNAKDDTADPSNKGERKDDKK